MPGKRRAPAAAPSRPQPGAAKSEAKSTGASRSVRPRVAAKRSDAAPGASSASRAAAAAPAARAPRRAKRGAAGLGAALGLGNIFAVMREEGPVVKCVLAKADGTLQELELDMTPRLGKWGELLGGRTTFLGQYASLNVVVMARLDAKEEGAPRSKAVLKRPFHEAEVHGDVLLVRMDDSATPQDFSLKEYEDFVPGPADDPAEEDEEPEDAEGEDDEDDEGDEDDEDDEDDSEEESGGEEDGEDGEGGDDDEEGDEEEDAELQREGEQCAVM